MSDCPACEAKRLHTPEEMKYHPYAGHGFNGSVWTHPDLDPARQTAAAAEGKKVKVQEDAV